MSEPLHYEIRVDSTADPDVLAAHHSLTLIHDGEATP